MVSSSVKRGSVLFCIEFDQAIDGDGQCNCDHVMSPCRVAASIHDRFEQEFSVTTYNVAMRFDHSVQCVLTVLELLSQLCVSHLVSSYWHCRQRLREGSPSLALDTTTWPHSNVNSFFPSAWRLYLFCVNRTDFTRFNGGLLLTISPPCRIVRGLSRVLRGVVRFRWLPIFLVAWRRCFVCVWPAGTANRFERMPRAPLPVCHRGRRGT